MSNICKDHCHREHSEKYVTIVTGNIRKGLVKATMVNFKSFCITVIGRTTDACATAFAVLTLDGRRTALALPHAVKQKSKYQE